MIFKFKGLMAPVFTPFNLRLELELDRINSYANYLKNKDIMGVLVNGTTGEGVSMTVKEREAVTEAWVEASKSTGQTLMVQVGGGSLKDVQRLAKHAESHKVGGILCLPDLFFRPTNCSMLIEYLCHVAEAAPNTPLLYYHIPSFTGVNLDMAEFLRLGIERLPTLAGIKFTHNDLKQGVACLSVNNGVYSVFLGSDHVLAGACALGFKSAIATTLNMFPEDSQNIVSLIEKGCVEKAREMQLVLNEKIDHIECHGGWVPTMKAAMKIVTGMDMGPPRPPLRPMSHQQIKDMIKYFGEPMKT